MPRSNTGYNAYMADYMLRRYHERRQEALMLLGGTCVRCGTDEDLNFDHIDASQKAFSIGKMWSVSREKFLSEIAKCQILCAPCHRNKTREYGDHRLASHGTINNYYRGKCRCDLCTAARDQHVEERRRLRNSIG